MTCLHIPTQLKSLYSIFQQGRNQLYHFGIKYNKLDTRKNSKKTESAVPVELNQLIENFDDNKSVSDDDEVTYYVKT